MHKVINFTILEGKINFMQNFKQKENFGLQQTRACVDYCALLSPP